MSCSSALGELHLHVPALSLSEAHKVVADRQPRVDFDLIRDFVRNQRDSDRLDRPSATAVLEVLSLFEQYAAKDRRDAPARIAQLRHEPLGVLDVFALDEQALARSIQIAADTSLALQSFDLAILAAVLVRGEALHAAGSCVSFCTLDRDLQPWDKKSVRRSELSALYDAAGVWVYGDFLLDNPARPESWPGQL
ncbi:MAG TPA: hypothetical protein VH165_15445 [Kofleriaceae bacterium]|nr:hypothetical protein [Kofleriaceae bacterium]